MVHQLQQVMTQKTALNKIPDEYFDHGDGTNSCFLCEQPDYKLKYKVDHFEFPFDFYECQCGNIKQCPMPNQSFFEWFFNSDTFFAAEATDNKEIWGYYDYFKDESSRINTSKNRYRRLKKYLEKSGKPLRIMKIGPATGTMLHVCKTNGHSVIGCDVSSKFANYASTNYGVEIVNGRFEKMNFESNSFDVLFLFNVVENVPNLDEFMREIHRTLKPGGLFISNYVPIDNNFVAKIQKSKYFLYRPPICYIFTKERYYHMLNKFGFSVKGTKLDIRYMHLEKLFTLLRWKGFYKVSKWLGISRINFPIYAYPSKIVIAEKQVD